MVNVVSFFSARDKEVVAISNPFQAISSRHRHFNTCLFHVSSFFKFCNGVEEHYLNLHFSSLTNIIICRFILNLRQVKVPGNNCANTWLSSLRFVGNAGESLQFDDDQEDHIGADFSPHCAQGQEPVSPRILLTDVNQLESAVGHDCSTRLVSSICL